MSSVCTCTCAYAYTYVCMCMCVSCVCSHFGSVRALAAANEQALARVPNMTKARSKKIRKFFHEPGPGCAEGGRHVMDLTDGDSHSWSAISSRHGLDDLDDSGYDPLF